ncbi:MAG: hypothetical protein RLZZ210_744 [Pseudomonadota bacterium]
MSNIEAKTIKIVLDTNIWLDFFVFKDSGLIHIITAIQNQSVQVYACKQMYDELERVLTYPQFARYNHNIENCLEEFNQYVNYLDTPPYLSIKLKCRDRDDQVFLDLCALNNIDLLISKDKQVLKLAKGMRRFGVKVITPNLFEI